MQAGLRPSGTNLSERRASPCPSYTMNQAGGTSSIQYEVAQKERMSSYVQYEESRRQNFVRPVRSRAKRELDLVHLV